MLRLLAVSDIHHSLLDNQLIDALKQELAKRDSTSVDYVLCPGDFLNLKDEDQQSDERVSEAEQQVHQMCATLSQFGTVLLVPGNHDPHTMFDGTFDTPSNVVNVHGTSVEIAPNLNVVGFGGSPEALQDSSVRWTGYPFQSQAEAAAAFAASNVEQHVNCNTILLTHVGPATSSTCIDTRDLRKHDNRGVISCGLDFLDALLVESESPPFLLVHGHVHNAAGFVKSNNTRVLNPGALKCGNFALVTLRHQETGTWQLGQVTMIDINQSYDALFSPPSK
ncbi:MAG: hypothetical protein MHM6MM_007664 [Cercozoa sp. M6MM]